MTQPAPHATALGDSERQIVAAVNTQVRREEARYHREAESRLRRLGERVRQLETIDLPQFRALVEKTGRTTEELVISRGMHHLLFFFLTIGELAFNMIVFLVFGESTLLTWAMALAVGLGLPAVAAFFGADLRQATWTRTRVGGWAVVILAVALTLAGINYVRTSYLDQAGQGEFVGTHPGLTVAYFMINMFVFIAATLGAYYGHDPERGFVQAKQRVERGRAEIASLRASLNRLARELGARVAEWHEAGRLLLSRYRAVNRRGRTAVPAYFDDEQASANRPAFDTPTVPEFGDEENEDRSLLGPGSAGSRLHDIVRRASAFLLLVVLGSVALVGCTRPDPRMIVVLVDGSCSVRDDSSYAAAWAKVVGGLHAGDRVVLVRISADTYSSFSPVVDHTMPAASLLTDNRLIASKRERQTREVLRQGFTELTSLTCAQKTPLLDAVALAGKLFGADDRRGVLVLASDMLEDGERYTFERLRLTPRLTDRILQEQRAAGLLPNLRGVTVYVAGAAGPSTASIRQVESFWEAYFRATGASLDPNNYGPTLMSFEGSDAGIEPRRAPAHTIDTRQRLAASQPAR